MPPSVQSPAMVAGNSEGNDSVGNWGVWDVTQDKKDGPFHGWLSIKKRLHGLECLGLAM